MKRELFINPSGIHGIQHAEEVRVLTRLIIEDEETINEEEAKILEDAALYHDIGRIDDSKDNEHGKRSYQKIKDLNLVDYLNTEKGEILKYLIENHCIEDEIAFQKVRGYDIKDSDKAILLLKALKDADALDRVRIGDLDINYLRLKKSKYLWRKGTQTIILNTKINKENIANYIIPLNKYQISSNEVISQKGKYNLPGQVFFYYNKPDKNKMETVKNNLGYLRYFRSTYGGLWTSSYDENFGSNYLKDLLSHGCILSRYIAFNNKKKKLQGYIMEPRQNTKLYVVESLNDLLLLIKKYPLKKFSNLPDHEAISKQWDGIYLPRKGFIDTFYSKFYLIDFFSEFCLWYKWCFSNIKRLEYDITEIVDEMSYKMFRPKPETYRIESVQTLPLTITEKDKLFPELIKIKKDNADKILQQRAEWREKYWKQ